MAQKKDSPVVEILHPNCCGLDVHKESISACLHTADEDGRDQTEVREFGTFTKDLLGLKKWLVESNCPILAMESTGVYWRPIHNVLEDVMEVILVNARHLKNVPGRKTDISDCKWLAGLLRHGLLKASFIPEKHVREWRELDRLRKSHVETVGDYKRRVHKLFETANIKIDSVVSDLFGVTGRNLIGLLSQENAELSIENIEKCAKAGLKTKVVELSHSLAGFFGDHHRFQLRGMMRIISQLEREILSITEHLRELMKPQVELMRRLDEVPGINEIATQAILGNIGTTLKEFASDGSLNCWAGICPGNNESAGKRKNGRNSVRSHPFKTIMVEVAWAAIKKKGSYYREKYYRLKSRIGPKKAIVAIANRITKAVYRIIKHGESYRELGECCLNDNDKRRKLDNLKRQAKKLGYVLVPSRA
ncbi:MAG: IS110 family transposase [Puia sp.]|nr:IS110 family transposase [Puia sp.]